MDACGYKYMGELFLDNYKTMEQNGEKRGRQE